MLNNFKVIVGYQNGAPVYMDLLELYRSKQGNENASLEDFQQWFLGLADVKAEVSDGAKPDGMPSENTETKPPAMPTLDDAAFAKLAEQLTFATDDSGNLTVNGKPTGISTFAPNKIAEAVADASFAENLQKQRAAQAQQEMNDTLALALEKGTFYLEDAVTDEDERRKILSGHYRNHEDAAINHAPLLQAFIDKLPAGVVLKARTGSVFQIGKNTGYKPELYGADGRTITRGGMPLTVDGQQPCILFDKAGLVVDFSGATFVVDKLGQDAFHIRADNVYVKDGGEVVTRAFLKVGYTGGSDGLYPPIDGWTAAKPHEGKGFAMKGYHDAGFNTATLAHDLSCYRNNAAHTDAMTSGGYGGQFPQDNGSTANTWGIWRGCQIGSWGDAWLISGCKNVTIGYYDVKGFNGDAVHLGMLGAPDGAAVDGFDVAGADAKGMVAENVRILGGRAHGNYVGNIGCSRVRGVYVSGLNCRGAKLGHPDFNVGHSRDNKGVSIDPGYGFHTSRCMPMDDITVVYNHFGQCARKVADAHTGNHIVIQHNTGTAGYYGSGTVIEEKYAASDGKGDMPDSGSFQYQDCHIDISHNHFVSGCYGIFPKNGALGLATRKAAGKWWLRGRVRIVGNTVYAPYGLTYNYGHSGFDICDNDIKFALPFGEPFGMRFVSAIAVTNGGSGYTEAPEVRITGGGEKARGASAVAVVQGGKVTAINLKTGGGFYESAPTVELVGGGGSGATAKASVNDTSFGYDFGSAGGRGPMYGDKFVGNRAANTPEGNYKYQFLFGALTAATITGNKADITPYRNDADLSKPYTGKQVHRSGIASNSFNYGAFTDCEVADNKAFNQLDNSVSEAKASAGSQAVAPARMVMDMADGVGDVVFDSSGQILLTKAGQHPPEDYGQMFDASGSPKFVKGRLKNATATRGVYPTMAATFDGGECTFIMPVRFVSLSQYKSGTLISGSGSGAITMKNGAGTDKFIINGSGLMVDGEPYRNTELEANTWYIVSGTLPLLGEAVHLGAPASGNNQISADFGEGLTVYRNIVLTAEMQKAAYEKLKTLYAKS